VNRFIDHLQVVTTNKYYIPAHSHTTNHSTLNLLSVLSLVVTALNNGCFSEMFSLYVSWQRILAQNYTPDIPVLQHTQSLQIRN
jgi:hypothetical protein